MVYIYVWCVYIYTKKSYICKIIINPLLEDFDLSLWKLTNGKSLKNSYNGKVSLVKTLQMPTEGKHIRQVDVLKQYRIVWAELSEKLSGNWKVATGNPDRRVTKLLWNDRNVWNTGLKYCLTHWYNYLLILGENGAKEKE